MNLDMYPAGEIPENYANWPRSSSEPSELHPIQEGNTNAANSPLCGSKRVFDVEIVHRSDNDGFVQYSVIVTNELYDGNPIDLYNTGARIPVIQTTNYDFAQHMAAVWCNFLGVKQKYKYIE